MSTFSGLNTAYTGLSAARQGMNVAAQNIANVNTDGYTRQRLETSAIGPIARTGLFSQGASPGQGVAVDAIARLGNLYLDTRVRSTAASAGYTAIRAETVSALEDTLNEPGPQGLSAQLQKFWGAWQDLANQAGEAAPTNALLQESQALASQLARGYAGTENLWSRTRSEASGMVDELNTAAHQVADLNGRIRTTLAAGGSVNELLDQRTTLTTSIASWAGGTVRENSDGTVDVLIGGNAIVSADTFRPVQLTGANRMSDVTTSRVQLEWAHRPGAPVALDGGEIAGAVSVLAAANPTGTGGAIAEAAASYDTFAVKLAQDVNAIHQTGFSVNGSTGLDYFAFSPGMPAAAGLTIIPTTADGIATGAPGAGPYDGTIADAISQISNAQNSPDDAWNTFVITLGANARAELQQGLLAESASISAKETQLSGSAVSLDEENINLLSYQHAYQAAARVMTAVDEMLNTLINRTGIVGR